MDFGEARVKARQSLGDGRKGRFTGWISPDTPALHFREDINNLRSETRIQL